ncbi:hypothetical protein ACFRCG_14590 [Embleya sp. NPDC056575]|uniref:hypothetical protein n=1 Tax=unclassified Embleya TaxID=2699296 RepID=UPI0036BE6ED6
MAKQKQKPHLKSKNPMLAHTEHTDSAPAQPTEAIDTLEGPKADRRGKSDRPKGRRR